MRRAKQDQGARVGLATRLTTPLASTPAEVKSCSNGYCSLTPCMLQNSEFKVCNAKIRLLSIPWPGVCDACLMGYRGGERFEDVYFYTGCDVRCDKLAIQVFPFINIGKYYVLYIIITLAMCTIC